jgi:hypothetical protein
VISSPRCSARNLDGGGQDRRFGRKGQSGASRWLRVDWVDICSGSGSGGVKAQFAVGLCYMASK